MDADFDWITEESAQALELRLGQQWQEDFRRYAQASAGDIWVEADAEWKNSIAERLVGELDESAEQNIFGWLDVSSRDHMRDQYGADWREVLHGYLNDTWGPEWTALDDDTKCRMWTDLLSGSQADGADGESAAPTAEEVHAYLCGELEVPDDVERALIAAVERGTLTVQPA